MIDGYICVWESLAILEYLAEKFADTFLSPQRSAGTRSCARDRLGDARRICRCGGNCR